MLSFAQVSYRYHGVTDPALTDVTFTVAPGEHVVLLGSNGSGKSTLARLANGLLLPEEGTVSVEGMSTSDRATIRTVRSQVGVIAQDPDNQIVSTTVLDEIAFGPENLGLERDEIITRTTSALEWLGLTGYEERDPSTLSGGEKQRLIIASILAMNPTYLVLDEPTSMLDGAGRAEVRNAINSLHAGGHGILHITHELSFARDADRVLVLQGGRLVFGGTPAELLNNEELLVSFGLKVLPQRVSALPHTINDRLLAALRPVTAPKRWRERGGVFPSLYLNNVSFSYGGSATAGGAGKKRRKKSGGVAESELGGDFRGDFGGDVAGELGFEFEPGAAGAAERVVLKGVNLNIAPGSYTLITGNSGSGKSTLLRILAGLLEPTSGTATFSSGDKVFPSAVGIVFQHPESQLFAQTVEDEIAFGPDNLGLLPSRDVRGTVVREALDAVGLDPRVFFHRSPFSLSGGEMRRVAIASILAMRPTFLLLDEPTAGLDAAGRAFIHTFIEQLVQATAGVVVVSHDVAEFSQRAQAHLLLKDGQLWRL
ncbi:MAG: ATP-binding cassette domain-containing protein [Coriobacteriales bacterium]|jgi:energy-coupling factor transport system ATP-binding protein|nr:ATP-binding cassette domain-containing protein [Coriobacteriales bacterium]